MDHTPRYSRGDVIETNINGVAYVGTVAWNERRATGWVVVCQNWQKKTDRLAIQPVFQCGYNEKDVNPAW